MLPWVFATISAALKDQSVGSEMKISIISDLKVCRSNSSEQDTGEVNSHAREKVINLINPALLPRLHHGVLRKVGHKDRYGQPLKDLTLDIISANFTSARIEHLGVSQH